MTCVWLLAAISSQIVYIISALTCHGDATVCCPRCKSLLTMITSRWPIGQQVANKSRLQLALVAVTRDTELTRTWVHRLEAKLVLSNECYETLTVREIKHPILTRTERPINHLATCTKRLLV